MQKFEIEMDVYLNSVERRTVTVEVEENEIYDWEEDVDAAWQKAVEKVAKEYGDNFVEAEFLECNEIDEWEED